MRGSADPLGEPWAGLAVRLRAGGGRWTPQRRAVLRALSEVEGHVTGAELVDRCRELDPATVPSTVYRTLDLLERMGLLRHAHGADGREEYHVLPEADHGHLHCQGCGGQWELRSEVAGSLLRSLRRQGFEADLSHLTVVGVCRSCSQAPPA
jgi:Fur family ferric uptake transcriptional regulator